MPINRNRLKELITGWKIQRNVIDALVYRELKTRVSEVRFGVIGVFIEPVGVMAIFLVIFSIFKGSRGPLNIFLFLASGIVLFTLFQDIAIRSSNGMRANEALFFYKPVKPIDTVIARTIVEAGLYAIVFMVIIITTFLFLEKIILQDIFLLVATYLGLTIWCFGLGLFLMIASHKYSWIQQLIPLCIRPLWIISGVFVGLRALPQWVQPLVSWNPIVQAIELSRHAFSLEYIIEPGQVSLLYLWQCAIVTLTIALWVYLNNERSLLSR